jgi:precorrin-8X/cobalt-precorrin-8 methylmutase
MDIFTNNRLPDSYAICLIGHGSRDPEGAQDFLTLSKKLRERKFCHVVESGFLEFGNPDITEALSACKRNGIKNIIVLPGILFSGKHTQRDVPHTADAVFRNHPEINLIFAPPLSIQPKVIEASQKRIEEEEKNSPESFSRSETLLMTIGHGSRDTGFNSKVKKNLSQLGYNMGFGKTLTGFAGFSLHYMEDMQEKFKPQRFRRVILLPFFLFSGVWVKRVHALADTLQGKYPDTEILKTSCLSHHALIIDALVQTVRESVSNKLIQF